MPVMYARNDIQSINIGEAHGGCGQAHHRPAGPDGSPEDLWFVDCPGCEAFLLSDPLWARNLDDLPQTVDEEKAAKAFEVRGAKALTALRVQALAKAVGLNRDEISPELRTMLTAGPVRVPGVTVCGAGHDNTPGSRFCSTCGDKMARTAPAAAIAAEIAEASE